MGCFSLFPRGRGNGPPSRLRVNPVKPKLRTGQLGWAGWRGSAQFFSVAWKEDGAPGRVTADSPAPPTALERSHILVAPGLGWEVGRPTWGPRLGPPHSLHPASISLGRWHLLWRPWSLLRTGGFSFLNADLEIKGPLSLTAPVTEVRGSAGRRRAVPPEPRVPSRLLHLTACPDTRSNGSLLNAPVNYPATAVISPRSPLIKGSQTESMFTQ